MCNGVSRRAESTKGHDRSVIVQAMREAASQKRDRRRLAAVRSGINQKPGRGRALEPISETERMLARAGRLR